MSCEQVIYKDAEIMIFERSFGTLFKKSYFHWKWNNQTNWESVAFANKETAYQHYVLFAEVKTDPDLQAFLNKECSVTNIIHIDFVSKTRKVTNSPQ